MAKVIVGMTISLDGYINDRNGSAELLYPDLEAYLETEPMRESILNTGAVIMGRNSYAMADDPDWFAEAYEYQVPIFVLTHQVPARRPKENDRLTITFVTDGLESAITQAKMTAGTKDVTIIGAPNITRQCIQAGLADELHVDIMPVVLGGGLRLFDDIGMEAIHLERLAVVELPAGRVHLRYRFLK